MPGNPVEELFCCAFFPHGLAGGILRSLSVVLVSLQLPNGGVVLTEGGRVLSKSSRSRSHGSLCTGGD